MPNPNLSAEDQDVWSRRYRDHLLGLGLSPKTVRNYVDKVRKAEEWAASRGCHLTALAPTDAVALANQFPNSASSRRQLRTALRHYWDMMGVAGPEKAIRVPRKPDPVWRGVESDDARKLVKVSKGWHPQGTAVLVGLGLGFRREEIAMMEWGRFDPDMSWYTVLGKQSRTHTLPVHQTLRDQLRAVRMMIHGDWVFPGSRRRPCVTPTTVGNWVGEVSEAAIGRRLTAHQLRHTAGATVHDTTGDMRVAQAFLRHQRLESTQVYTRTTAAKLLSAIDSLDYLDDVEPPT